VCEFHNAETLLYLYVLGEQQGIIAEAVSVQQLTSAHCTCMTKVMKASDVIAKQEFLI